MVIVHATPQTAVDTAVTSPLTAIATDGFLREGKGHPRTSGTYSLILGRYVRERRMLSLSEALAKCALMPAQRLERRASAFARKGRLRPGMDADIVIFDADRVIDNSTYESPTLPPTGIEHVIVVGTPVVSRAQIVEGAAPGVGIRA